MHAGLAERAVVREEAAGHLVRGPVDEPPHDFDAQAARPTDQRLGALARDDPGELTPLAEDRGGERLRAGNAFKRGPWISRAHEPRLSAARPSRAAASPPSS